MDFPSLISIAHAAEEAAQGTAESGIVGTFGINWKLFVAQLVNFGIVLFVFWKWVVKPLGRALEARQTKIEKGLKDAEMMELGRKNFEEQKVSELRTARQEAEQIIKNAETSGQKLKNETLPQAQTQAEKLIDQTKATLAQEKEKMMLEVRKEAAELVASAAAYIIREKIDKDKDRQLIEEGLKKAAN